MSNIEILSDKNIDILSRKTSEIFEQVLIELSAKNEFVVGAWPGGRSLKNFFPSFSRTFKKLQTSNIVKQHFFQVDERVYQEFNRDLLDREFFSELVKNNTIKDSQIHYFDNTLEPVEGVKAYTNLLNTYGGRFNYSMLGAGGPHLRNDNGQIVKYDCHVAGIFANHESSKVRNQSFMYYFDSPKPPPGRITATYDLLSKSDCCFLFIMGEEKKEVLKEFLNNKVSIEDSPIKIAYSVKKCVLITDQKI